MKIYEFQPGLLHAKTITLDGEITLIGLANMDRRRFDLNYENNILLQNHDVIAEMYERQMIYFADTRQITLSEVKAWSWQKRMWNNALAIVGPVL